MPTTPVLPGAGESGSAAPRSRDGRSPRSWSSPGSARRWVPRRSPSRSPSRSPTPRTPAGTSTGAVGLDPLALLPTRRSGQPVRGTAGPADDRPGALADRHRDRRTAGRHGRRRRLGPRGPAAPGRVHHGRPGRPRRRRHQDGARPDRAPVRLGRQRAHQRRRRLRLLGPDDLQLRECGRVAAAHRAHPVQHRPARPRRRAAAARRPRVLRDDGARAPRRHVPRRRPHGQRPDVRQAGAGRLLPLPRRRLPRRHPPRRRLPAR